MSWNPAVGVPMLIVGIIVLALVWLFGRPRQPGQGKRVVEAGGKRRREPVLGEGAVDDETAGEPDDMVTLSEEARQPPQQGQLDIDLREELERLGATLSEAQHGRTPSAPRQPRGDHADGTSAPTPASELGRRPADLPVERIVTLYVVAREGERFRGSDIVVAAEKTGLEYGDMGIFHRLLDGKREAGPVFSVANMIKPGSFDMRRIDTLDTPGLSCFMTLPAPVSALDGWDAMLPAVQRLAELLDGLVLDSEHNALGRQRIAYIRDELRGWDRRHEGEDIQFGR